MKNLILYGVSFVVIMMLFCQCSNNDELEISLSDENRIIEDAGEIHNELVIGYINNYLLDQETEGSSSFRINKVSSSSVVSFFNENYGVDIYDSPYYIFSSSNGDSGSRELVDEFDPFQVLEDNKENLSEYFYSKYELMLKHTQHLAGQPELVAAVIDDFRTGVKDDVNLSQKEREDFLIILDVYQSSLELWTFVEEEIWKNDASGRFMDVPRNVRWKIAAADFSGGLIGGLVGGPVGALAGLAGSSIEMTIGLWETSQSVDLCNGNISCQITAGNIPSILPSNSSTSTSYSGQLITANYNFYTRSF